MPGSPDGLTALSVSSTASVVPAPTTSRVCIRFSVTLKCLAPAGLHAPLRRELVLGVDAAEPRPPLRPLLAVEVVEVGHLPVRRPRRRDAQHLGALARPVERPVAVAPVERERVVGPEALGERLVVEPRLLAVGRRRERQRPHDRQRQHRRDPRARLERQPLEPQEADGERGQHGAEHDRLRAAERDERRGHQRQQQRQRQERVAAPALARPERQQRRGRRTAASRAAAACRSATGSRPRTGSCTLDSASAPCESPAPSSSIRRGFSSTNGSPDAA